MIRVFRITSAVIMISLFLIACRNNKKDNDILINEEGIPEFLESGLLKGMWIKGHVYIDDTAGIKRLNIPIFNRYPYEYWDKLVAYTTFYELYKNGYINPEADTVLHLSIIYDLPDTNRATYRVVSSENFKIFKLYPRYYSYCRYAVANMWPEDFKVYDWAMEDSYKETGNKLFDRPFHVFFEGLSHDDYLSPDEKYILDKLMEWTTRRKDFKRLLPFEYFLQSFDEGDYIEINAADD